MSLSRSAYTALRQAEAEGLTLALSGWSSSGYKGVFFNRGVKTTPYQAEVRRGGKKVGLGTFATAEEAALCYARSPEGQAAAAAAAAPPAPPPMTAEEALRQAEVEGLTLLRSESSATGYKNVSFDKGNKTKPYQAQVRRGGEKVNLGSFAKAEEAALCFARTPEGRAAVAAAAAPPAPPPMTADEALRQAEAEGLTLLRSERSSSGYGGVSCDSSGKNRSKPYKAQVRRGGPTVTLGHFTTAEEAALVVARDAAAQAASPQPPSSSSRKRKVKSVAQPPGMPAGARVKLEEEPPPMPNDAVVKLELES